MRTAQFNIKANGPALRRACARNRLRHKWNLVTFCGMCDTAVSSMRAACYALQATDPEKITWPVLIAALMIPRL